MKKILFAMFFSMAMIGLGKAQEPAESKGPSAAEQLKDSLSKFAEQWDGLDQDLADLQLADIRRAESAGRRVHLVSYQEYQQNTPKLVSGIGRDYDDIAIEFQPGEAQSFYDSLQSQPGYSRQTHDNGNVVFSSNGNGLCSHQRQVSSNCVPCQPMMQNCAPSKQACGPCPPMMQCGPCPGAQEFQQYNAGRPIGQRIFGEGYNGRTLRSTWQAAPLRPYLITHAFQRLENPARIGQGRILNFAFPRIRYKNGYICSEHDMKVHLGRRQWAIVIGTSAATAGGGGVAIPFLIP